MTGGEVRGTGRARGRGRAPRLGVVTALCALLAAGCAQDGAVPPRAPAAGEEQRSAPPQEVYDRPPRPELPLDAYLPPAAFRHDVDGMGWRDADLTAAAEDRIYNACMERYGYGPDVVLRSTLVLRPPPGERRTPYVRIRPDDAEAYGYHRPHGSWAPQRRGHNRNRDPERRAVQGGDGERYLGRGVDEVNGEPLVPGGCEAEAVRGLAPGPVPSAGLAPGTEPGTSQLKPESPAQRLRDTAWQEAEKDPRLERAVAAWAACMGREGFPEFSSPVAPEAEFRGDESHNTYYDGEDAAFPHPEEAAAAGADSACNAGARLEQTWVTVVSERERELMTAHRADLEDVQRWWDGYLANARRLHGG